MHWIFRDSCLNHAQRAAPLPKRSHNETVPPFYSIPMVYSYLLLLRPLTNTYSLTLPYSLPILYNSHSISTLKPLQSRLLKFRKCRGSTFTQTLLNIEKCYPFSWVPHVSHRVLTRPVATVRQLTPNVTPTFMAS